MAKKAPESLISTLLAQARAQGQQDAYSGKRQWARYSFGMRLDVTTDPTRPSAGWHVTLHNVSGGGVGFWSKRELDAGTTIHISDGSDKKAASWLKASVQHCTVGLRGYLIGAAFDEPIAPDAVEGSSVDVVDSGARTDASDAVAGHRSLQMKCALATAAVGIGSAGATGSIVQYLSFDRTGVPPLAVAIGFALAAGFVWGWLLLRKESRFLRDLQKTIKRTTASSPDSSPIAEAPSREFAALRHALVNLSNRWRQREEDARIQRQKLEELTQIKSNILAIVSHDLRTPLTSILMYAHILLEDLNTLSSEDQRNFLGIISEECTRLSRLVDDLLEVQRLESDNTTWDLRSMDLSETIHSCVRVFDAMAQSKSIELVVNCPPKLPPVAADSDKISQVLSNLVSNAIKYTPADGRVEVSAQSRGHEIVLGVADNGLGIPRDKWDQIFDRFAQLSDPNVGESTGVGLGLNIVKKIIEGHGGAVWVDSEMGEGSTFYVSLPTVAPGARPCADVTSAPARRILVCDSDPEMAATIAQTLRGENLDVRVAHSGQRLLAQLDQGEVEVVLTDLVLPDMEASDLLAAMGRKADRSFRTIVHSYEGDARELRRQGVDIFLKRPVSKDELVRAVGVAMQKRTAGGLSVVVVDDGFIDVSRIQDILSATGNIALRAGTWEEAVVKADDSGCDVVMVSRRSLTVEEVDAKDLESVAQRGVRVIVLNTTPRRNDRPYEHNDGITYAVYRAGKESELLEGIWTSDEHLMIGSDA